MNSTFVVAPSHARPSGWRTWIHKPGLVVAIYLLVTIILYVQAVATGRYNNFIIFRSSFYHLQHGQSLYQLYPAEYFDLFLYHPSFPVLFAPFALLPQHAGLFCWLISNALIFLYMLRQLPMKKVITLNMAWFLLLELSNAIQSDQTNPAMVAFMVLTVVYLQKQRPGRAAFFAALCFFIKGYGAIAAIAFLFFPKKISFIGWGMLWLAIGTALPLLFISPALLYHHYIDWFQLVTSPVIREDGSVIGMLNAMTGMSDLSAARFDKGIMIFAVLMLVLTIAFGWIKKTTGYAWLLLAFLLIWIVVFNQSTESPTYIIAVTGVAIACYTLPLQRVWRNGLLLFTLLLTSLAPTDLVPKIINNYAVLFHIKAFACVVVLFFLQAYIGGWRHPSVFNILVASTQ